MFNWKALLNTWKEGKDICLPQPGCNVFPMKGLTTGREVLEQLMIPGSDGGWKLSKKNMVRKLHVPV
jgi:hypothetical protein